MEKKCTLCGEYLHKESFSSSKKSKDGFQSYCKRCNAEREKRRRLRNKQRNKNINKENIEKCCPRCKTTKKGSEFNIDRTNKNGLSKYCIECSKIESKKRRDKNKETINEKARQYHWDNREYRLKYLKEYADKNREKLREQNKEYRKENYEKVRNKEREYYKNNREKLNNKRRKRANSPLNWNSKSKATKEIGIYENIRESSGGYIETPCAYCGIYYVPTSGQISSRVSQAGRIGDGEGRLYCSENCKKACPIYFQKKYPRDNKPATSREVQPQLRQLVFQRDNYACQKCGLAKEMLDVPLHCHHIDPVSQNPIESADEDNCITLCETCHREMHQLPGCTYSELKCVA